MKSDVPSESVQKARLETLDRLWTTISDQEFGRTLITTPIKPHREGDVLALSFNDPIHRKHIGSLCIICANYSCLGNEWWASLPDKTNTVTTQVLTKSVIALWEIASKWEINKDDIGDVYMEHLTKLKSAEKSADDDDFISTLDSIFMETLEEEEDGEDEQSESPTATALRFIAKIDSGDFCRYSGVATEIYDKIDRHRRANDEFQKIFGVSIEESAEELMKELQETVNETAKEFVKTDPVVVLFTECLSNFYSKGGEFDLVRIIELATRNYERHGFQREHATIAAKYMAALTTQDLLKGDADAADVLSILDSDIASCRNKMLKYPNLDLSECRKNAIKHLNTTQTPQAIGCLGIFLILITLLLGASLVI